MWLWIIGGVLLIAVVAIGGFFLWQHFLRQQVSPSSLVVSPTIPDISTPSGWYSWGKGYYLPGIGSGINDMTFGDQPINNTGNNSTTLITVHVHNTYGKTDEQWIDTYVYPTMESSQSPTSSRLWEVMNGNLVLQSESLTPAGNYDLSYFLFDNGVEYEFDLVVSPFNRKPPVFPTKEEEQALRAVVESVASKL